VESGIVVTQIQILAVAEFVEYYDTGRNVAVSIPDEGIKFTEYYHSPVGKGEPTFKSDNAPPSASRISRKVELKLCKILSFHDGDYEEASAGVLPGIYSQYRLLVTASVVHSSTILVTLVKEALISS
jgi:hypothetical protein